MTFAESLYRRAPVWLQNVAISGYGLRLLNQRYGSHQRRVLGDLLRSERWPAADLRRLQLTELTRIVRHAANTVELYRDQGLRPREFRDLAEVLELRTTAKADLQTAASRVVATTTRGRPLEIHTGGTTGRSLTIYCDRPTLQRNYAFFERFRRWAGVDGGTRTATFAGRIVVPPDQAGPPYWRFNAAARTCLLSSYHLDPQSVPAYVEALARFRPGLIDSYPSSIEPIARYCVEHGIESIRPRAVITSSETLFPEVRATIEKAFSCRVFDHYGAAEMAAFITQCERGTYHPNPEFGLVEIVVDDRHARPGEQGEIVATGFINPVMPLIRYRTGDLATAAEGSCPCGREFPMLAGIEGRIDDVVVTPDGRRVGRLDPIFKAVSSVADTQIVQDELDHIRVEIVPNHALLDEDRAVLLKGLRDRLGAAIRIDIVVVDSIPRTARGKRRTVVSRLAGRRG